jgi:hypothetical protein
MTETLYMIAFLWSLERAIALAEVLSTAVTGLGDGVGARCEPGLDHASASSHSPMGAGALLWLVWRAWRSDVRIFIQTHFRALFLAGVVLLAFIFPWTYRNYRVYHGFLLLNSNTGYAMYSAQHPMHGACFQAFEAAPLPADLMRQDLTEVEWDRALMRRGIGFVLEEPGRYVLLSLSRLADYFEFWPTHTTLLNNAGRLLFFYAVPSFHALRHLFRLQVNNSASR